MFNNTFKNSHDSCYCDLVQRTEAAYNLNKQNLSRSELLDLLKSPNKDIICYALLNIDKIENQKDIEVLLSLLKDTDSRVRELASSLIKELLNNPKYNYLFNNENYIETLTLSIKDNNPKVCRNITSILQLSKNRVAIIEKLIKIIETDNNFTIYWCLYAIEKLLETNDENISRIIKDITRLINKTSKHKEYQIRERSAFIVSVLSKKEVCKKCGDIANALDNLTKTLSNDENFYVKNAIS